MIQAGGSGPGEEDEVKHQAWRSSSQAEALVIAGDVTIDFWAAIKDFQPDKRGRVTIYLRDQDDTAGYTEIGDATVNDRDWQGGSGTFVKKTLVISGINYTVPVDHALEAKLIVHEQSEDDVVFAYDTTTHPSVVKLP